MDANDHSKPGSESEIGRETQKGPESEDTDGGDPSMNVPDDNIGIDAIYPGDGVLMMKVILHKKVKILVLQDLRYYPTILPLTNPLKFHLNLH
jgi:hypothetical protein